MNFKPKSKEELETMNLLKPGIYHFRVANAKDKTSKNGNEMIEITLEVYDNEGHSRTMFDYLLEAMPQKLFAFCTTTGMEHFYHQGGLTANDCIDKSAYVEISVQKGKPNPQGGDYPDKNEVKRYMTKPATNSTPSVSAKKEVVDGPEFDDGIPF